MAEQMLQQLPQKKLSTIQVDLDGHWVNSSYYGNTVPEYPDDIFTTSIPRYLDLFEKYGVKATFFVIGKDLEIPQKRALVKKINRAGHEVANHTYSHIFGFRKLILSEKILEIQRSEELIEEVIGKKPLGFKVPGYDIDIETLQLLSSRGYLYDSSVIPTFAYPLLMGLNRFMSGGVKRSHGPKWSWCFAPNAPYWPSRDVEWRKAHGSRDRDIQGNAERGVLEVPCTTLPFFRLPFHATFINKLGFPYFWIGRQMVSMAKIPLNYEFHAVDLADDPFPQRGRRNNSVDNTDGMDNTSTGNTVMGNTIIGNTVAPHVGISLKKREALFERVIKDIASRHTVITTEELVRRKFALSNDDRLGKCSPGNIGEKKY